MKRYEILVHSDWNGAVLLEKEHPEGDWVRYEDAAKLKEERDAARDLVSRALELASPIYHPEHWLSFRAMCERAAGKWGQEK